MSQLRRDGKPYAPSNKQADKLPDVLSTTCLCTFVDVGVPLNARGCKIHSVKKTYNCDLCSCNDYRPSKEKKAPNHWPACVCGHSAQDHN